MSRLDCVLRTLVESTASLFELPKSCRRNGARRRTRVRGASVEGLEERMLLTSFIVNTTSDDADDAAGVQDGLISLREAIVAANTNAAFGDAPAGMATGDIISFAPSVFTGSDAARTITLGNGVLIVTDDLRITGVASDVILNAAGGDRVFRIVSNQLVVMTDLTLQNARSTDGAGGGAIRITGGGRTILGRVTIQNSTAVGRGGAMLVIGSTLETYDTQLLNNTAGFGGGLASVLGIVTLNNTLVDGNTASGDGGGLSNDAGRLILRESVVSSNTANAAPGLRGGGGIHNINNGRLAVSDSTLFKNSAANARGGAIYSSSGGVTIGGSTISENFAALSGGGIDVANGELFLLSSLLGGAGDGTGNLAGAPGGRLANGGGLHLSQAARVEIDDSRIQFNEATGEGGGLWNSARGTLIVRAGRRPSVASISEGIATDALGLQATVDEFRTRLGVDNGGVPGSQGSGRREINWDGVPNASAAPNLFPGDFFNDPLAPLARGAEFSTPGQGFQVSANNASAVGVRFSNINPNYTQTFDTFSPERLFTPIGSNVTLVNFFIPGTSIPAVVQGFGAVFTDVDIAGATTLEFFDVNGQLLLTRSALAARAESTLTFLGATFSKPAVAQVRITTGTGALGPKDVSQNGPVDVVVLDDFIYGEPVTLQSVAVETLIRGNEAHGNAAQDGGGGIFNDGGRVEITDTTIRDNLADGTLGSGGGIFSRSGSLILDGAILSGNDAARAGGGIEVVAGLVTLTGVTLGGASSQEGNAAGLLPFGQPTPGNGGGLHVSGQAFVRVTGGTVQNNFAAQEGGGLWNSPSGVMIVSGGTQITGNVADGDKADDGGGGIFNMNGRLVVTDATISGNRATGISGSGGGIFTQGGAVTLTNTTFDTNSANRAGGGIEVLAGRVVLQDVTLSRNAAGDGAVGNPGNGGGLHSTGASRVDIFGGLIQENTAAQEGGGLWNSSSGLMILHGGTAIRRNVAVGNDPRDGGGGLFNDGGRLAIAEAEISGNVAFGPGSTGGGLLSVAGVVTIENSTISGNTANSAGGGIANYGILVSTNNTIVLNVSNPDGTRTDGGGVFSAPGATSTLRNTIVAGNLAATQTRGRPRPSDLGGGGSFGPAAFNLIGNALTAANLVDGDNGNIVGMQGEGTVDLAAVLDINLMDNGGPTRTHALTFSSLALNRGSNALARNAAGAPLRNDQRGPGFARIFNSTVDIGAFER